MFRGMVLSLSRQRLEVKCSNTSAMTGLDWLDDEDEILHFKCNSVGLWLPAFYFRGEDTQQHHAEHYGQSSYFKCFCSVEFK